MDRSGAQGRNHLTVPTLGSATTFVHRWWPMALVVGLFLSTAVFIVPTLAPFSWHDDWVFARSAEILYRERRLEILDAAAPNAVFEAFWGAAFGEVFGMSLGVLRFSSVVLLAASIPAAYLLALDLQASRAVAAIASAAFVFNPLLYVLGFTFMTDAHFVAMEMIAMWLYFRAVRRDPSPRLLLVASLVATMAFLSRQQGLILPATAAAFLLVTGKLKFDGRSIKTVAAATAIPLAAACAHAVWLRRVNGLPSAQSFFFEGLRAAGPAGMLHLFRNVAAVAVVLTGFFVLPIGLAAVASAPTDLRQAGVRRVATAAGVLAVAGLLVVDVWPLPRMPAATSWFARHELGPASLLTHRQEIFGQRAATVLTAMCIVAVVGIVVGLVQRPLSSAGSEDRGDLVYFGIVLAAMLGGVLLGSVQFAPAGLDRYYLPLLPPAFALGVAAVAAVPHSRRPVAIGISAIAACLMGAYAVAGTRDSVVFQAAVWRLGTHATVELGIPKEQLDAGPGWDGYHMGHTAVPLGSPEYGKTKTENAPWWIVLFAPGIDSTYVIATERIAGWDVISTTRYQSWLHRADEEELLLLRRPSR